MLEKPSIVRAAGVLALAVLLVSAGCSSNLSNRPTSSQTTTGATSAQPNGTPSQPTRMTPQLTEEAIVEHVNSGYRSLRSYHGTFETTTVRNGTQTRSAKKEVWARPHHDDLRIETLRPNTSAGNVFVTNGSVTWSYVAEKNTATKRSVTNSSGSPTQFAGLPNNVTDLYDLSYAGNATVAGHSTFKVTLTPKNGTKYDGLVENETVWFDTAHWFPIKRTVVFSEESGTTTSTRTFTDITFDTTLSEGRFRFDPPKGTTVTTASGPDGVEYQSETHRYNTTETAQSHVDFAIAEPTWLPDDYALEHVTVVSYENASSVSLFYTNATNASITISQVPRGSGHHLSGPTSGTNVTVNGHHATYVPMGKFAMVRWTCGGFEHSAVTPINESTTQRIANATACAT